MIVSTGGMPLSRLLVIMLSGLAIQLVPERAGGLGANTDTLPKTKI
jgi:hypothetical protein